MELSDLTKLADKAITLSDIQKTTNTRLSPVNETSASILALQSTGLSNGSREDFDRIKANLLSQEARQSFILQQEARREEIRNKSQAMLPDILLSTEVSDESKLLMTSGLHVNPGEITMSTLDEIAEESVVLPSGLDESEEASESRNLLFDIISDVNEEKALLQSMINQFRLEQADYYGKSAKDFGELLVPFAEWLQIDKINREVTGSTEYLGDFMGEQKNEMFDLIRNVPVGERAVFTENLLDILRQDSNVVMSDGNTLVSLDILERMVLHNNYSETERWFDNITSVLDIVGAGVLVRRLNKLPDAGRAANAPRPTPTPTTPVDNVVQGADEALDTITDGVDAADDAGDVIKVAEEALDEVSDLEAEAIATATHNATAPTAPSQIVKNTNPELARTLTQAVDEDVSGDIAKATHGASREEALAKDILPEPEIRPNQINNKPMARPQYPEDEVLKLERVAENSNLLTKNETRILRSRIVERLSNVEGMVAQTGSLTIKSTDSGTTLYRMMYRPLNSGFKTVARAVENAEFAFRKFGLTRDNLQLYYRNGDKWVETTESELVARKALRDEFTRRHKKIPQELKEIDYSVGINYEYKFNPEDLDIFDVLQVKRNFFDRMPVSILAKSGQGSLTQNLFDASSVLDHARIVGPASVAVDRSVRFRKLYTELFDGFVDKFRKLDKNRRADVMEYINEANFKELALDPINLRARGFNTQEINMLKQWRRANDNLYHATNADMVMTLRQLGYQLFTGPQNTKLVVREASRKTVSSTTRFYDAASNTITTLPKTELDSLYEGGGTLARLSEPTQILGEWVDVIKVNNTPNGGFIRALNNSDTVLSYREGYYPVMYDANFFIQKTIRTANGEEAVKTVASSRRIGEAEAALRKLVDSDTNGVYKIVQDQKRNFQEGLDLGEGSWKNIVASNLSNQRIRGERLVDAGVDLHKAGYTNLVDPLEAVAGQIKSLSNRIAIRPYLETLKSRWINNYFSRIGLPPDKFGKKYFPTSISEIKNIPNISTKLTADARTLFNYIYSLENGYINGIDQSYKAAMNWVADEIGKLGLYRAEDFTRGVAKRSPVQAAKTVAFKLYLAANPARQLLIQSHQNVQLAAINPKYVSTGLAWDSFRVVRASLGYTKDAEALEMYKELQRTGLLQAVDANNLVRTEALRLADLTAAQKIASTTNAPLKVLQKVGFDVGEQSVLVSSWLAHRDMALRDGKKLTRAVYDQIHADARAYTYNMNRAGDMPYNGNTLSMIAQFIQVPHKAFLQPLTNRQLSRTDRARLFMFNTIMYGVPAGIIGSMFVGEHVDNETERWLSENQSKLEAGLETYVLNWAASTLTGTTQQIDWGDFAPTNAYGLGEFLVGLATTDIGSLVANSPSGSILFGKNPRLHDAFKTAARYFNLVDDYEEEGLETRFSDVVVAAGNMFSGFSNAYQARYAYLTGQKMNQMGNISDYDVTKFEAFMQAFGFKTQTETGRWKINEQLYADYQFRESDVSAWYNELKRQLARRHVNVQEQDFSLRVMSEGWRVFEDHEVKARESLMRLIERDMKAGEYTFFDQLRRQIGSVGMDNGEVRSLIETMPDSEFKSLLREELNMLDDSIQRSRQGNN